MEIFQKFLEMMGAQGEVIIILVISFIILIILLNKFLFKPVTKHLDNRSQEIKATFDKIALEKESITRLAEDYKTKLTEIERAAYQKTQEAIKEGLAAKTEIISEAHAQSENILRKAQAEIEQEKQKALVELRNEIVTLALAAAGKIIEKEMDEATHRKLVEGFLSEIDQKTVWTK
jgi:F-type H+-transporting ATPase subunit b